MYKAARGAEIAMCCSVPSCWKNSVHIGIGCDENPAYGCFRVTATGAVISPSRHQARLARLPASRPTSRHPEKGPSPHAASLLRHSSARSRRRSAHHSDPVGPQRSERDHHLSASFAAPSSRDRQPAGLAAAERQLRTGGIDEPAAPGGGRSHPRRGSCLPPTKPPVDRLEACQSAAGHRTVSHRRTGRASGSMHSLRASCHHLLQLLPKPALPEVSDRRSGTVDCGTLTTASANTLRPCGLHAAG